MAKIQISTKIIKTMETSAFEKLMSEAPERADETKIIVDSEAATAAATETPTDEEAPAASDEKKVVMSAAQFGATVTGIYTAVSDFVYKKIKKTDTAPAWGDSDRESLNNAITPVLEQYNVTMSPITNLIITLAMVEALRYAKKPAEIGEEV